MQGTTGTRHTKVIPSDGTTDLALGTTVATAAGASALTILAAGGASVKNRLYTVIVSADTAGLVTLSDSCGALYCAANGSVVFDYGILGVKQGTANTAITATNGGGGNLAVVVIYKADA